MRFRKLGYTNLEISVVSFGAGPVSTLMVDNDEALQSTVIAAAVRAGINWFDTAATYGAGESECNLGRVLEELGVAARVHVATKVRFADGDLSDFRGAARRSLEESLSRLRLSRVTLLQLHNSITEQRGDEPTSITPADVLGRAGVAEAFHELREEGLCSHVGLTGIGQAAALHRVIQSGEFETMQVPYNILNPSAGRDVADVAGEANYGNVIQSCADHGMGVMAIRVLAGGALAGNPPSPHTLKTPFFPLALYERDRERANRVCELLAASRNLPTEAMRFVLAHPHVHSAIIGFADTRQVDEAVAAIDSQGPPMDWNELLAQV